MNKTIPALLVAATVAGCTNLPWQEQSEPLPAIPDNPSDEWVEESLPAFEAAAQQNPTPANIANYKRVKGYSVDGDHNERVLRLTRQLTMAYDNFGRAGAAIRQPGYIHVLHEDFNVLRGKTSRLSKDTLADELAAEIEGLNDDQAYEVIQMILNKETASGDIDWIDSDADASYSLYELARWGRYCDGGKDMDEDDWRFVRDELPNMPDVFDSCQRPNYGFDEYMSAWGKFCESSSTSRQERDIVRDSVHPHGMGPQSCAPLQ